MKRLLLFLCFVVSICAYNQNTSSNYSNIFETNSQLTAQVAAGAVESEQHNNRNAILYYLVPLGIVILLALLTIAIRKRILFDS